MEVHRNMDELLVSAIRELLGAIERARTAPASATPDQRITSFSLHIIEDILDHRRTADLPPEYDPRAM